MHPLVEKLLARDPLALSRLMSLIENRAPGAFEIMKEVHQHGVKAHTVGVTGPPGAGKSTLIDQLIHGFRAQGRRVGVVAIDPSSPFSGGAVMGDRIRMQAHAEDQDVFIRSLGTRGSHGGLSRATREIVKLLDAYGMEEILVETVGVGQTELDIMGVAETTIVVVTPESGDTIQTMKAGILEIADIFVVNKADRPGADHMVNELKGMIEIGTARDSLWKVPVLPVQARDGIGTQSLVVQITEHRKVLQTNGTGQKRREQIMREETRELVLDEVARRLAEHTLKESHASANPYEVAEAILTKMKL